MNNSSRIFWVMQWKLNPGAASSFSFQSVLRKWNKIQHSDGIYSHADCSRNSWPPPLDTWTQLTQLKSWQAQPRFQRRAMCNGNFGEIFQAGRETAYTYSMQSHAKQKHKEHWLFLVFWKETVLNNYAWLWKGKEQAVAWDTRTNMLHVKKKQIKINLAMSGRRVL